MSVKRTLTTTNALVRFREQADTSVFGLALQVCALCETQIALNLTGAIV